MKIALNVVGGLLILSGVVFFLQGIGFLLGSYMTGQSQWAINGAICFVIGVGIVVWNYRRK